MRSRYAFAEVLLLWLLLFCVMAGAGNGETPQDEKMEIPIDFPFCGEEKDGRPPSLGYGETNTIHTWVGEEPEPQEEKPEPREETVAYNGYEHVRNYLEDYPSWHTEEYESREALLTDFGFGLCRSGFYPVLNP